MKGEFIINIGQIFLINRFYKDSDHITKSIEKKIHKCDETLEVLFSGYMINYTMVFNQIKRSIYDKGCDAFNKILEYKGELCFVPTGNACFRKCLEFIHKKEL